MVRFFGQHELGGAGQWVEAGLGQRAQLELAVAVGEVREHVEGQPVRPTRRPLHARRGRSSGAASRPSPTGGGLLRR
ncbi:hypothetical protein G6F22_020001 [Rhizopus arrhizus]|nr:hypothetical protein G6F22_020001 [Rhizopus arrhizus]